MEAKEEKKRIYIKEMLYGRDVDEEGYLCDVFRASDGEIYRLRMKDTQANGYTVGDDITKEIE